MKKRIILATILIPVFVLGLTAYRYHTEVRRLEMRSRTMADQLELAARRLAELRDSPLRTQGSWSAEAAGAVAGLAQMMVDEVADWRILYGIHEVPEA